MSTWGNGKTQNLWDGGHGTWGPAKSKKSYKNYKRCWEENHQPIEILNGTIFGAACAHPQEGYDIYIGLDYGMRKVETNYPWETSDDAPIEFLFHIPDMGVPKDVKNFKKMIQWMAEQLEAGKHIQIGCIGGHGRTGTVLAALVAYLGIPDQNKSKKWNAIQWVRANHCKKAVESASQINFLAKHYHTSKVKPSKGAYGTSSKSKGYHKGGVLGTKANQVIRSVLTSGTVWGNETSELIDKRK